MLREIKIVFISLIIVCFIAPLSFDVVTVPITMQTFILFSIAALFGKKIGFLTSLLYLLVGAAGLPVFGGSTSGYEKLYGPTAGFLLAFPFISYYVGWECERRESNFFNYIVNFVRAHFLLLIPGFIVLYLQIEGVKLWPTFVRLLPGLMIKSIIGGILTSYLVHRFPEEWVGTVRNEKADAS